MLEQPATPFSNRNQRLIHVRKFACNPPTRGHTLRLVTIEEPPMVLGEWDRVACADNGATAEDIDGRLREHADTAGQPIGATLSWNAEDGQLLQSKRLNCKPALDPTLDPAEAAKMEALGINGTELGKRIQDQRHHEAMVRSYFSAHQTQVAQQQQMYRETTQQQHQMISLLGSLLKDSYNSNHTAQIELDKLRMEQRVQLDRLFERIRTSDDGGDPESKVRGEFMAEAGKAVIQLLPFIIEKVGEMLVGGAEVANDNAAAPSSSTGTGS